MSWFTVADLFIIFTLLFHYFCVGVIVVIYLNGYSGWSDGENYTLWGIVIVVVRWNEWIVAGLGKCNIGFWGLYFCRRYVDIRWWMGNLLWVWVLIGLKNWVNFLWWNGNFARGLFDDFFGWVRWNDYTFFFRHPFVFWWKYAPIPKNITVCLEGDIFCLL